MTEMDQVTPDSSQPNVSQLHVLMAAAECRGLAKVGGLADVVRDLSSALVREAVDVRVVLPYYASIRTSAVTAGFLRVQFGRRDDWPVEVCRSDVDGVPVLLLKSPEFFGGEYGEVYIDSDRLGRGPFEDDAQRFAFFSAAAAELLRTQPELAGVNALHAHDWHTGVLLLLLARDPRYSQLASRLQSLFTIHNLDYQGVRPFELEGLTEFSSFSSWFPELYKGLKERGELADVEDPRADVPCFNPMRAGINLSHDVNTVSPNYADEITRPDDAARNFIGGRGLEGDLRRLGPHLHGILNGLDYALYDPNRLNPPFDCTTPGWEGARADHKRYMLLGLRGRLQELERQGGSALKNAETVLAKIADFRPETWQDRLVVVAVTRAVRQKVSLLLEPAANDERVVDKMLEEDVLFILLGTGELGDRLDAINAHPNGLFIAAFDPALAESLYAGGDLFLMPSDFEPCGISQMIAMRYGCLPLVSDVGGLTNTVQNGKTGFVFAGRTRDEAREALLGTLSQVRRTYEQDKNQWRAMQEAAMQARFEWSDAATRYIELYRAKS